MPEAGFAPSLTAILVSGVMEMARMLLRQAMRGG
jgi:hypothetical protein